MTILQSPSRRPEVRHDEEIRDRSASDTVIDAHASPAISSPRSLFAMLGRALMRSPGKRTRPRPLVELGVIALCYFVYEAIRVAVRSDADQAIHNARQLHRAEIWLHLDPEHALNHALTAHAWLSHAAGYYYATLHFVVTPVVLLWLYWRHPGRYPWLRRTIMAATLPSLLVFWAVPLAPPRFAVSGITDTLAQWNILGGLAPRDSAPVANLYAAMPSLHFAWALWSALAVWLVARRKHPALAMLAWIYPTLTGLDVMATGNHYLLDLAGGAAALLFGMLVATGYGRLVALIRWHRAASAAPVAAPTSAAVTARVPQPAIERIDAPTVGVRDAGAGRSAEQARQRGLGDRRELADGDGEFDAAVHDQRVTADHS
jgi:PAP2 superfamily